MLIKWKTDTVLGGIYEDEGEGEFDRYIEKGEEFEVEKIEITMEDEDNGDCVNLFFKDGLKGKVVAFTNSDWFEVI